MLSLSLNKSIIDSENFPSSSFLYLVNLSKNWVNLGKSVIVYGNFNSEKTIDGVVYTNMAVPKQEEVVVIEPVTIAETGTAMPI
mgnify:CR=1 FL=1